MGPRFCVTALSLLLSVGALTVDGQVKRWKTKQGGGETGAVRPAAAETSFPTKKMTFSRFSNSTVFPVIPRSR